MGNRYKSSGGRSNVVRANRSNTTFKKSTIYKGDDSGAKKAKKKAGNRTIDKFLAVFVDGWNKLDKQALVKDGLFAVVFAAVGLVLAHVIPVIPVANPAVGRLLTEAILLAVVVGMSALFMAWQHAQLEPVDTQVLAKGFGYGLVYGLIWLGGPVAILLMYSGVRFLPEVTQIDGIAFWVVALLLRAMMTEFFAHGVVYRALRKKYNFAVAAVFAAVVFLGLNAETAFVNPYSFLTMLSASIFFSAALESSRSIGTTVVTYYIWLCVGGLIMHMVNLPADYPHMMTPIFTGSILLSGGAARLEGSLITLVINVMFIFSFYGTWVKNYKEQQDAAEARHKKAHPNELGPDKVRIGGRVYPNVETHIGQKTRYAKKSFFDKLKDSL